MSSTIRRRRPRVKTSRRIPVHPRAEIRAPDAHVLAPADGGEVAMPYGFIHIATGELQLGGDFGDGEWITAEDLDLPMPRESDTATSHDGGERGRALSWLQREALRIADERREVRRRELIARCRIPREVARRELAGLVRLGLLRLTGRGRGARYRWF
jgi:hypothetical protein